MAYTSRTGAGADPEHHEVVEATDARQGRWGRHMLWVLLAGLVLVIIALFGTWFSRAGDLEAVDAKSRATAEEGPQTTSTLIAPKNRETDVRPADVQPK
jgi:hypothetical protein